MNDWSDWLTETLYRVRVMPAARAKLAALPPAAQEQLRQMLGEVTSLAEIGGLASAATRRADAHRQLLTLGMGRMTLLYTIDDLERTLTVHHAVALTETGSSDQSAAS